MAKTQKQGKKSRKHGRCINSPAHKRYNAERRWLKHKAVRVARYIRKHPNWKLPGSMNEEVRFMVQNLLK
jgi:hypothetical protein